MEEQRTYTAFVGESLFASGLREAMLRRLKARFDEDSGTLFLIFDDQTGRQVDFDLRGTENEVLTRAAGPGRTGPGRPKLGVVSREISLLPRHWEWLEEQPNGASATLRRLVDEARKHAPGAQRARQAKEAVGRVMSAMAGNLPGYEEASRALYSGNRVGFEERIREWPADLRGYFESQARNAFDADA